MVKKLLLLLLAAMLVSSVTSFAAYQEFTISGGGGFAIVDRSYEDQEEDYLLYYHSGCSQSMKIMPVVQQYAKDHDLQLYIVDYRKGKFPGASEYLGSTVIQFPAVIGYNHGINVIHGLNGIKSEADFKRYADEFFSLENPEIKITIGSDVMYCNGNPVTLDVPAMLINDRTMVPLRAIMEAYGFGVEWDAQTNYITAKRYETVIKMHTSGTKLSIGRMEKWMHTSPQVIDGRTLIPARSLAEALGAQVTWDGATQTVTIQ